MALYFELKKCRISKLAGFRSDNSGVCKTSMRGFNSRSGLLKLDFLSLHGVKSPLPEEFRDFLFTWLDA